ncbi:hypothetical protein [Microbacterium lacus]|uniref:Uncharacterized protein n=1 Tax=Microbacterium lacus TaxID=415217 RepID=A0ABN2GVD1_9MICO
MSRKKTNTYTTRRVGPWSNTARGDSIYISVYCRGTATHSHDKWRIGSITAQVRNGEIFWADSTAGYADHSQDVLHRISPGIGQYLVGNEWVPIDRVSDQDIYTRDDLRIRWRLRCPVCGFSREIAQPRRIYPILATLATLREADNILEIPVREFARRVERLNE